MKPRIIVSVQATCSRGFSLLEILVGILILMALIAIILPFLNFATEKGKQITCLQNLRVFGTGCLTYIADNRGLPYWDGKPGNQMGENSTFPNFYQWLVDGGYIPSGRTLRCSKASSEDYQRTYGMQYGGNSALCIYYNTNPLSIPFPTSRVVMAAENYSGNFNIAGHLNRTIWGNDSAAVGPEVEGSAPQWPTPQYHGSSKNRGLNLFFMDGHTEFVTPVDNDWRLPPVYGANDNAGLIYDRDQIRRIKNGNLHP